MSDKHWTSRQEEFQFAVAFDFVADMVAAMEEKGTSQKELASRMGVSESRVSQLLNDPGNLTLATMVGMARALDHKISIVAYDDGDHQNLRGPVIPGLIRECWEVMGKPADQWQLDEARRQHGHKLLRIQGLRWAANAGATDYEWAA